MRYLTTENTYQSPEAQPGWFSRRFPTISFYVPMIHRVWWGARQAQKGKLDREKRIWGASDLLRMLESVGVRFQIENLDPAIRQKVDFIIDAGRLKGGRGSTVIDVTCDPPRILREGAVSAQKIQQALKRRTQTS